MAEEEGVISGEQAETRRIKAKEKSSRGDAEEGGRSGRRRREKKGDGGGGEEGEKKKQPKERYAEVSDEGVRALLQKEDELTRELGKVRNSLAAKRKSKDQERMQALPEKHAFQEKIEEIQEKIEGKKQEKDAIYAELSTFSREGFRQKVERDRYYDHLEILKLEIEPVRESIRRLRQEQRRLDKTLEKTTQESTELRSRVQHKSLRSLEKEMADSERKLIEAHRNGHESVESALKKRLGVLRTERTKLSGLTDIADGMFRDRVRKQEVDSQLEELAEKFQELSKKMDETRSLRDQARPPKGDDKDQGKQKELRKKIDVIKAELDVLVKEKKETVSKGRTKKDEKADEAIRALAEERDGLVKELDGVRKQIPTERVDFDPDFKRELVGTGGATIRELERDHGCTLDVREQEKVVVVRGGSVKEAAEAVREVLAAAAALRHQAVVDYDPATTRQLLGSKGTHIQRIESQSSARLRVLEKEGKVRVVGSKEAVELASQLLTEFVDTHKRAEFDAGEHASRVLRPRYMRSLQEESGCRVVRIDTDTNAVFISGRAEQVQEARQKIEQFMASMTEDTWDMRLPAGVTNRAVIGRGAENAKAIEDKAGVLVNIGNEHVHVIGPKDGVAEAKKLVEALVQDLIREEILIAYPAPLHGLLVRPGEKPAEAEEPPAEQEEEEPPEQGEEGEEGEEPTKKKKKRQRPKKEKRLPCFLEEVRRESGCDSVMAKRDKAQVLLVGKRHQVIAAKAKIEAFLVEHRLVTIELECAPAVSRLLRDDKLFKEARRTTGVEELRPDGDLIIVSGSNEGTRAARDLLRPRIAELTGFMVSFTFDPATAGSLIGKGGSVLRDVQKEFHTVIEVDKARGEVSIAATDAERAAQAKEALHREYTKNCEARTARDQEWEQQREQRDREWEERREGGEGKGRKGGKGKGGKGKAGKGGKGESERPSREEKRSRPAQKFSGWAEEDFPPVGGSPTRGSAAMPRTGAVKAPPPPSVILEKRHAPVERIVDPEWQRREREKEKEKEREKSGKGGKGGEKSRKGGKGEGRGKSERDGSPEGREGKGGRKGRKGKGEAAAAEPAADLGEGN
eukprot:Hpha_TRINITY_DN15629_c3_g8::TRINITY_DN15629_c3_g8_i1::g.99626::m.99626